MQSLLVFPLLKGDGAPVGALTVAARAPERFVHHRREMLALVVGQLGIKLDLAQAHERLRGLASRDGLTGLNNHRTFQQGLGQALARAERRKAPLSLLLVDIDHFKPLNDTHGHPFGDTVLKAVARVIERAGRRTDLAARYGGEEFALILEDSDAKGAAGVAERVRTEIEALRFEGKPARVTVSVGLAVHPEQASTQAELIARADAALYTAKKRGRNQVCAWQPAESNDEPA
jgi:diguanylate cyclase (GGDEF)-like protein